MKTRYSKETIPLEGWHREETFRFFSTFSLPFFNVHTEVDLTPLYQYCKAYQLPVSLAYMHATIQAACATENFLYRIEQGQVVKYSGLDISTTVLRNDQNVAFTHLPYHTNLEGFCRDAAAIIATAKESRKLFNGYQGTDLLHVTTLPWFAFKGMEHATDVNPQDPGVPKIAYGRLEHRGQNVFLPLSIGLHHALADGYHMHLFVQALEKIIKAYIPLGA